MKISVLMVLDQLNIGGTETHVLSVVKELMQRDVKVVIVAGSGPFQERFNQLGIRIYELPFHLINALDANSRSVLTERLLQICKRENITILHAHQTSSALVATDVAQQLHIPLIFTVHGTYYDPAELRPALAHSSGIIAVSIPVQSYIANMGFASKVIPNGIDVTEYYPADGRQKRNELGIPEGALVIVNAGRLAWEKAQIAKNTIQVALSMELEKSPANVHVIIAGDGNGFDGIKRYANTVNAWRGHKFIHMLGNTQDLLRYYASADFVVGTGRVALESMSCGKPLVAIGTRGHFGLVKPENFKKAWSLYFGDHGSIQPASRSALTREVRDILRVRSRLPCIGLACREWVTDVFSIGRTCDDLMMEYHNHTGT